MILQTHRLILQEKYFEYRKQPKTNRKSKRIINQNQLYFQYLYLHHFHTKMGQSNSTAPLIITQSNQEYKDFNYSRLISDIKEEQDNKINEKIRKDANIYVSSIDCPELSYFSLHRFETLNGDDLLVKDRETKFLDKVESSTGTLRNISNQKLTKQRSSLLSRTKITSIANLQIAQQQSFLSQSQIHSKPSHIKFAPNQHMVGKNFIFSKYFNQDTKRYCNKISNYFIDEELMRNYVSNLVKLNQVLEGLSLYDDFTIVEEDTLFIVERTFSETIDFQKGGLTKNQLKQNVPKFLNYLHFVTKIYQKIDNIYIDPEDVYIDSDQFFLADFKYKETTPSQMILATLEWVYKSVIDVNHLMEDKMLMIDSTHERTLEECFYRTDQLENSSSFPLYLKQLWKNLVYHKLQRHELLPYIQKLKCKAVTLSMNIDSFHACLNHKKTWSFHEEKHSWLIGKKMNEIYFYNLTDDHKCQVKVVRKKKKIDLSAVRFVFDPQQLEVKYIAQNSKIVIRISEFELQKSSCKSDIEIKHRLPVKFKNPFMLYISKKEELLILQNCVYKYSAQENRMYQLTKKLSQSIFLARSHDFDFMVVKMSIDIFRNGIRVFINQNQLQLFFVGEQGLLQQMSNIRVDIRSVQFCKEIYKGVYLMLASRNMWILDTNFSIFFSFATIERVKSFYGFAAVGNSTTVSKSHNHRRSYQKMSGPNTSTDYAFEIFNQPFKVEFLPQQEGLNVRVKDDELHVIGDVMGNPFYLKYAFFPEAGSLKLLEYKSLVGVDSEKDIIEDQSSKKSSPNINFLNKSNEEKIPKKVTINVSHIDYIDESRNEDQQSKRSTIMPIVINPPKYSTFRPTRKINNIDCLDEYAQAAPLTVDKQTQQLYTFNFHQENLPTYKNEAWLYFQDSLFLKAEDFFLKSNKTNFEIQLKIKKVKCSLKDLIQKIKKFNESKSAKQRRYFTRQECLFYMTRCLQIYAWLVKNELYHRNLSVANFYFMKDNNVLKLIGWSQPQRNWYVSDYKDLLMVFFNVITCNTFEKLNQKMLYKYKTDLEMFPIVYEKMQSAYRLMKQAEKKGEVLKEIKELKDYLHAELSSLFFNQPQPDTNTPNAATTTQSDLLTDKQLKSTINKTNCDEFIFTFEFNTPKFSMISTLRKKKKKMICLIDQNSNEQFIFQQSDKFLWDQKKSSLYIFTSTFQFYQLKINTSSFKEESPVCEEYEYLPNNVLESTFVIVPDNRILSIGGVYKAKNTQLTFNKIVYQFNAGKLTWEQLCELPQPRINPLLALSKDGKELYCMGGEVQHSSQQMSIIKISFSTEKKMDGKNQKVELFKDPFKFNPFSQVQSSYPSRIFSISSQNQLFLLFSMSSQKYFIRLFSLNSFCVNLVLETKNYSDQNKSISSCVGITLNKDTIHVLREYGKYAKINLNKLEGLVVVNQTVYPQREEKME